MRISTLLGATALSFAAATGAAAMGNGNGVTDPVVGSATCSLSDISPTAANCVGWFEGNISAQGNANAKHQTAFALNALLGTSYGSDDWTYIEKIEGSGTSIDFATALYGDTVVSVHVGGANGSNGIGYNGTAFFLFDAGMLSGGLDAIMLNRGGYSNAVLYTTGTSVPAVPEPATWLMMILGFAAVGGMMRRRSAQEVRVRYS